MVPALLIGVAALFAALIALVYLSIKLLQLGLALLVLLLGLAVMRAMWRRGGTPTHESGRLIEGDRPRSRLR
jgi:membrane protein implicated in regulation of membrane protease activity